MKKLVVVVLAFVLIMMGPGMANAQWHGRRHGYHSGTFRSSLPYSHRDGYYGRGHGYYGHRGYYGHGYGHRSHYGWEGAAVLGGALVGAIILDRLFRQQSYPSAPPPSCYDLPTVNEQEACERGRARGAMESQQRREGEAEWIGRELGRRGW